MIYNVISLQEESNEAVKGSASAPHITNTLLPAASYAESYRGAKAGNLHPSEPNYIWLEAGDNLDIVRFATAVPRATGFPPRSLGRMAAYGSRQAK